MSSRDIEALSSDNANKLIEVLMALSANVMTANHATLGAIERIAQSNNAAHIAMAAEIAKLRETIEEQRRVIASLEDKLIAK